MTNKKKYDIGDPKAVKQLKEVLNKSRQLRISRVPAKTREAFIEIADEHFEGDYGMLLKWLLEEALEYQNMKEKLIDLGSIDARLRAVEEAVKISQANADKKVIKLLDGSSIPLKK
mgnify:CR=1 FL=1